MSISKGLLTFSPFTKVVRVVDKLKVTSSQIRPRSYVYGLRLVKGHLKPHTNLLTVNTKEDLPHPLNSLAAHTVVSLPYYPIHLKEKNLRKAHSKVKSCLS